MGIGPSTWSTQSDGFDRLHLTGRVLVQAATAVATAVAWVVFLWVWWSFADLMASDEPDGGRDLVIVVPVMVLATTAAGLVVVVTGRAALRGARSLRRQRSARTVT